MRKNIVLMRHALGNTDGRFSAGKWIDPESAGPESPQGRLPVGGYKMVQKVSEWLKGQGIGTSAIYHSKNIEPTRTAYGLAGEFPHVKLLELELLEGEYELGDGVELDALLETEDGFDGFDTIVLITHEPVVRVIAKRRGVSADPIGYATTIIFFPNGGWEKFSPGWCGW